MFDPFLLLQVCGIQWQETQIPQSIKSSFFISKRHVGKVGCVRMITCSSYYDYVYVPYTYKFGHLSPTPTPND